MWGKNMSQLLFTYHGRANNKLINLAVFGWLYFWLMLMLMLIYYERKILFHGWMILANKLKRTEPF
jgi:hypothetical protein